MDTTPATTPDITQAATTDLVYDVLIAGGGMAGLLTAAQLAAQHPTARIAVLERDSTLGGRLRASAPTQGVHGYGLHAISDDLFGLLQQTLTAHGVSPEDSAAVPSQRQQSIGVLAGGRIVQQGIDQWFTPKGARILGGLAAARQWNEVEAIVHQGAPAKTEPPARAGATAGAGADAAGEDDDDDEAEDAGAGRSHAFSHYWKKPRKVPAAIVLEHFASAVGIPDVWSAAATAIDERARFHAGRLHCSRWNDLLQLLVAQPSFRDHVHLEKNDRIIQAVKDGMEWTVTAEKGTYRCRSLVIAQPPWQAAQWLKRTLWPAALLQVASKTKPVSIVVLSEQLSLSDADAALIPDVVIVPSERVQIIRNGKTDLCFQATIDYELSLSAPAVVKAVKALKRARKKLQALYPDGITESGHVALLPVAWAQSPVQSDHRWLERMAKKPFNTSTLAFCGDAYGNHYDGDANLIKSVLNAVATVAAGIEP